MNTIKAVVGAVKVELHLTVRYVPEAINLVVVETAKDLGEALKEIEKITKPIPTADKLVKTLDEPVTPKPTLRFECEVKLVMTEDAGVMLVPIDDSEATRAEE